jgi:hypothetical protein
LDRSALSLSRCPKIRSRRKPAYVRLGLGSRFSNAISDLKFCLSIRNCYAHSLWHDANIGHLSFVSLEEAAKEPAIITDLLGLTIRYLDINVLAKQETYFNFVDHSISFLNYEGRYKRGDLSNNPIPAPASQARPPLALKQNSSLCFRAIFTARPTVGYTGLSRRSVSRSHGAMAGCGAGLSPEPSTECERVLSQKINCMPHPDEYSFTPDIALYLIRVRLCAFSRAHPERDFPLPRSWLTTIGNHGNVRSIGHYICCPSPDDGDIHYLGLFRQNPRGCVTRCYVVHVQRR